MLITTTPTTVTSIALHGGVDSVDVRLRSTGAWLTHQHSR
jgi:hypothetical protein